MSQSPLGSTSLYAQHINKANKHPYRAKRACAQKPRIRIMGGLLLLPIFPNLNHQKISCHQFNTYQLPTKLIGVKKKFEKTSNFFRQKPLLFEPVNRGRVYSGRTIVIETNVNASQITYSLLLVFEVKRSLFFYPT